MTPCDVIFHNMMNCTSSKFCGLQIIMDLMVCSLPTKVYPQKLDLQYYRYGSLPYKLRNQKPRQNISRILCKFFYALYRITVFVQNFEGRNVCCFVDNMQSTKI